MSDSAEGTPRLARHTSSLTIDDLVANEVENDTPGVTVTDSPLNVNEESTATYTVVLDAEPGSEVTITVTKATGGDENLTLSGSPLTFTDSDWDTAQTVTVSAAEDDDTAAGSATFEHGASSGDTRYHGQTIDNLVATEVDNDTLGAPANLRAAPGDRQVRLSWDAVTGATEYEYQQTSSGSFGTTWSSTGSTETSTTVTGLNNGTQCTFRVRAVKVSSPRIAGPPSNPVEAMPLAAPLNLVAIPGDKYITLSWNQAAGVNEHNWLYYFGRGLSHGLWLSSTHDPVLGEDGRWTVPLWGWNIGHGGPARPSLTNGRTYPSGWSPAWPSVTISTRGVQLSTAQRPTR